MSSNSLPPPLCLALLLCDAIHHDPGSGKRTILGTFSVIFSKSFPAMHPRLSIYAALTDGYGETDLRLDLVHVDKEDSPVASARGKIDFVDPRMVVEIDFVLTNVVFPEPGEYRFQLYGNNDMLMERRVIAVEVVSEQDENNG